MKTLQSTSKLSFLARHSARKGLVSRLSALLGAANRSGMLSAFKRKPHSAFVAIPMAIARTAISPNANANA